MPGDAMNRLARRTADLDYLAQLGLGKCLALGRNLEAAATRYQLHALPLLDHGGRTQQVGTQGLAGR